MSYLTKTIIASVLVTLCVGCNSTTSKNHSKQNGTTESKQPNIIFFIADDMYPHMFNSLPQGKGKNLTPNLDRLAQEGSFLTETFVSSPVCTPSRYNVLTGNYASRASNALFTEFTTENQGQTVIQWNSFIQPGVEKTVGHHLQELGYYTGFVGKNHVVEGSNQLDESETPDLYLDPREPEVKALLEERHTSLQQDIYQSGFNFADSLYHNNPNWLGIKALAVQNMDWITSGGVDFLSKDHKQPFFLYFATTLPHAPTQPERSWQADPKITPKGILDEAPKVQPARDTLKTRIQQAGLENTGRENLLWLDDALGALLNTLEKKGELDNTIIFFFNDHGQNEKGTLYNGGLHSQAIVWRKGGFACGQLCDIPVSNIDFLETILEFAGHKDPSKLSDGRSFAAALDGEALSEQQSQYFELGYARAVIKGKYKYLALRYPEYATQLDLSGRQTLLNEYNEFRRSFGQSAMNEDPSLPFGHLEMVPGGGGAEHGAYTSGRPSMFASDQLYNLDADPKEQVNLANDPEYAELLHAMKQELQGYIDGLPGKFEL